MELLAVETLFFLSMSEVWNVQELAIFSLDSFVFGIDSRTIREIFSISSPDAIITQGPKHFPIGLYHHQIQLPLLDLRRQLGFPALHLSTMSLPASCISFYRDTELWACLIDSVQNVLPALPRRFRAVPRILSPCARRIHLWGVYDYEDSILPLLEISASRCAESSTLA